MRPEDGPAASPGGVDRGRGLAYISLPATMLRPETAWFCARRGLLRLDRGWASWETGKAVRFGFPVSGPRAPRSLTSWWRKGNVDGGVLAGRLLPLWGWLAVGDLGLSNVSVEAIRAREGPECLDLVNVATSAWRLFNLRV
jgi:hypothetical protein